MRSRGWVSTCCAAPVKLVGLHNWWFCSACDREMDHTVQPNGAAPADGQKLNSPEGPR